MSRRHRAESDRLRYPTDPAFAQPHGRDRLLAKPSPDQTAPSCVRNVRNCPLASLRIGPSLTLQRRSVFVMGESIRSKRACQATSWIF